MQVARGFRGADAWNSHGFKKEVILRQEHCGLFGLLNLIGIFRNDAFAALILIISAFRLMCLRLCSSEPLHNLSRMRKWISGDVLIVEPLVGEARAGHEALREPTDCAAPLASRAVTAVTSRSSGQ